MNLTFISFFFKSTDDTLLKNIDLLKLETIYRHT